MFEIEIALVLLSRARKRAIVSSISRLSPSEMNRKTRCALGDQSRIYGDGGGLRINQFAEGGTTEKMGSDAPRRKNARVRSSRRIEKVGQASSAIAWLRGKGHNLLQPRSPRAQQRRYVGVRAKNTKSGDIGADDIRRSEPNTADTGVTGSTGVEYAISGLSIIRIGTSRLVAGPNTAIRLGRTGLQSTGHRTQSSLTDSRGFLSSLRELITDGGFSCPIGYE